MFFFTNYSRSFQDTNVIWTGVSDCHKMIITVFKTTFKKAFPKDIICRSYKNVNNDSFKKQLQRELANVKIAVSLKARF